MKTVRYSTGGSLHLDVVPMAATPASLGLASWSDTGERFVSYRCLVTPRAGGRWSGHATLVPSGWTIGAGSGDRRVCRYATDRDGSDAIGANIEHRPTTSTSPERCRRRISSSCAAIRRAPARPMAAC